MKDTVCGIPDDIWVEIFDKLPALSLIYCTSICQSFRRLAEKESLWRNLIQSLGWTNTSSGRRSSKDIVVEKLKATIKREEAPLSTPSALTWLSSLFFTPPPSKTKILTYALQKPANRYKCIFLGDYGVGKTCIINRIIRNTFRNMETTIGYRKNFTQNNSKVPLFIQKNFPSSILALKKRSSSIYG
jgi:hypothetical protein